MCVNIFFTLSPIDIPHCHLTRNSKKASSTVSAELHMLPPPTHCEILHTSGNIQIKLHTLLPYTDILGTHLSHCDSLIIYTTIKTYHVHKLHDTHYNSGYEAYASFPRIIFYHSFVDIFPCIIIFILIFKILWSLFIFVRHNTGGSKDIKKKVISGNINV